MMDIVERLRNFETTNVDFLFLKNDAALEIEKLREERNRLREALKSISKIPNSESAYGIIQVFVDDALKEKE